MAKKQPRLDPFHWHEALDRSLLAGEFFSENVEPHPVIQQTPELKREAKAIAERMFSLYQTIAALTPHDKK